MSFILKMTWRDSRASRRRLLLAAASIVLGISALVAIGSVTANLRRAIDDQAKQLLGADLAVSSRRAFPAELDAYLDTLGEVSREVAFNSMVVFPASGQTRLVQVRAIAGGFPFYGDFVAEPASAARVLRDRADAAILQDTLIAQFEVKRGDAVRLGKSTFAVAGAVKKVPGESFAAELFAPRIFIPLDAVSTTGLLAPGSISRHRAYVKLPPGRDPAALEIEMKNRFPEERLRVETVAERKRSLGRAMENVDAFLSLIGFIALLLGAIGVASAIHVYVRQKLATVALLRCLGATARQSFCIYVFQGLALGVAGALAGSALGVAVQAMLSVFVRDLLPVPVEFFVSWPDVARGGGAGLVICALFALWPLLQVRRVPPLAVLRAEADSPRRDPAQWALTAAIVAAVTLFSVVQAPGVSLGLWFAAGLAVCFALLFALARLVMWMTRRFFPANAPYTLRQGLANLYRPNNRTTLSLVSLGLGTALILTLILTRTTLLGQLRGDGAHESDLIFFDVQDDQREPLKTLLASEGAPVRSEAPVVTMRLQSVKGRRVEELLRDRNDKTPGWTLRREYRSTYRNHLSDTERLVAGRFEGRVEPGWKTVPVSMEEGLAKDMQLALGDELVFDVQGVPVPARIASFRAVEWRRMEPNFFVVFPGGVLEDAPKFHMMAVKAGTPEKSARLQRIVAREFPNVSSADLALVLETLETLFSRIEWVVGFVALFTVATGVVVMIGTMLTGRSQRLREMVLLRTLGATRARLSRIQIVEYTLLGSLAALTGAVLALGAGWALARFVFVAPFVASPGALMGSVALAAAATTLTGWWVNRAVGAQPPLEVLRQAG